MKDRLTKLAGSNATYRVERVVEIIDKLTDIENKEQSCIEVLPQFCHERLTEGTLNGNSMQAKKNNKLFILENAIERGGLVSTEWHNEQVMQLQSQQENSITLPVKLGTTLYFIVALEDKLENISYSITKSSNWVYVISNNGIHIEETSGVCSLENNYDYTINTNVFAEEQQAKKALKEYITYLTEKEKCQ